MRRIARRCGMVLAGLLVAGQCDAQILSADTITVVVPFPPGASADLTMRLIAQKVSEETRQSVIIRNMGGGGGVVGANAVKEATPDGRTLLEAPLLTYATTEVLAKNPSYHLLRDFAPVTSLWSFPLTLVVPGESPAKSMAELAALGKSRSAGLSFASQGVNTSGEFLGEMFRREAGIPMTHIPYAGAAPAIIDLMAGRVDLFFVSYASVRSYVLGGKLRVLAVASGERSSALPQVPTTAEAGFPDVHVSSVFALLAPAKVPAPVIDHLNQIFVRAAQDPDVIRRTAEQGTEIRTDTPPALGEMMAAEFRNVQQIVGLVGTKVQ